MSQLAHKNLRSVSDTYMKLIRKFPLRPIRTESEYDAAAAILDKLVIRPENDLEEGERDYLAVLSDLIEAYDDVHYPVPSDNRPVHERLRSIMEDQGMSTLDLAQILGVGRSVTSLILNGKRRITASHAKALGERFKLEPGYFL